MTITELLPKLSPSAQAEIEKVLNETWEPKVGDKVYVLDSEGDIYKIPFDGDSTDKALHARSLIFRTREEAEQDKLTGMDAKLVAQTTINRFCEREGIENKFVGGANNWCPRYEFAEGNLSMGCWQDFQYSTIFNVRLPFDAEKIITACGNEIKILLGVE